MFGLFSRFAVVPSRSLAAGVLFFLAGVVAAEAQTVRFIHTGGNDANACTAAAPCRTLQRGINAAPPLGEVRLLNSGVFGNAATIDKPLRIFGNGGTLILAGPLTINAPGGSVALDNITLNGRGVVADGLVVTGAASVHIAGSTLERFGNNGLSLTSAETELFIADSVFRNNGNFGAHVVGNGATPVTVENSRFENNGHVGLKAVGAQSSVTRSTFAGNGVVGLFQAGGKAMVTWSSATGSDGAGFNVDDAGVMQLESVMSSENAGFGIFVESGSLAVISNVTISGSSLGIRNFGVTRSRGNNTLTGNTVNVSPNPLETVAAF